MGTTHVVPAALLAFLGTISAQSLLPDCAAAMNEHALLCADPSYAARRAAIESFTQQYLANNPGQEDGTIITIPVVCHVVWNTAAENVSDVQVNSQIAVLNEDFRRMNADAVSTLAQFQGVAADTEIQFCLATRDPNGLAHTGIVRVQTSATTFTATTTSAVKFSAQGGSNAWPSSSYLNMWVCDIEGLYRGLGTFPGGAAAHDGIVIDYAFFGRNGPTTPPYHLGRTATHEVGHWLNLIHIWGDGGCGIDDLMADTPDDDAPHWYCPLADPACTGTAMVQNYMDYTDDACMNIFTQGQRTRMRAVFSTGGPRASLLLSMGCAPVATTVMACSPNTGSIAGGTNVIVTGTGFMMDEATTVRFGGIDATGVVVTSGTTLDCITPAAFGDGAVDVHVISQSGAGSLANGFVYTLPAGAPTIASLSPNSGPVSGGSVLVVTGSSFDAGTRFRFGATTFALASLALSPTQAVVVCPPAWTSGSVTVVATNSGVGTGLVNGFTYIGSGQLGAASLALNSTGIGDLQIVVNAAGFGGSPCMNFMSLNTALPVNTGSFFGLNPDANTYGILGLPFGTDPFLVMLNATGSYSYGALGVSLGLPPGFALDFASVVLGGPGIAAKSPAVRRIF